jgi:tRNA threonylcarbamoyladenosine biosynthesis protein TsaE
VPTFQTTTPEETVEAGRALAARLGPGGVVALVGDLGAGKTHFVRGLAAGWGADPGEAASPTFALLHEYAAPRGNVHHLDLYRAANANEVWSAVHDELDHGSGLLVIEWADRFTELVPPDAVWVRIRHAGEGRREFSVEP